MTAMYDPAHPGEIIREAMEAEQWTVTEAAIRLGVTRTMLSRVLNGKASVSPQLALALERLGWSDAGHWVRMQGAYDLAQARKAESAA
ncbi:MAG: HigA family addiction module antitoxin [Deltaproteobacteria bacterium]|nr:HigA family addiction module antitoxin [Deltaproteobacteria bacterium]